MIARALHALEPVDLASVDAVAALQERVDRKYLVPVPDAAALVDALAGDHRVLEIAGRRSTSYRSRYVDTPDLRLCRDHLQGRRRRWKARTRHYREDGLVRFEVKVRGSAGETLKHALVVDALRAGRLGGQEREFLAGVLGCAPTELPVLASVLDVDYRRSTLVDLEAGRRVTIDLDLRSQATAPGAATLLDGEVVLDPGTVIVETKGGRRPATADLLLREAGHRPVALSKYAASAALLAPSLPDNLVRPLLRRGLRTAPAERRAS